MKKSSIIGPERLKSLVKLLPTDQEEDLIRNFRGSTVNLDPAEKFLVDLVQELPQYRQWIDGMLLYEEFQITIAWIKPTAKWIIDTAQALMDSESLRGILRLILKIGNFLNNGECIGSASGFAMNSLLKLSDVRSNVNSRITLLHYLVQEIETRYPGWLHVDKQFPYLKDAAE
ncbi:FH2 domain-containing protein 1 [Cichlidogyrus casuarinus]|uniref:FH2 domain-containing protein 1 n=1 Tax=Cichlidogyrus casuarinus TaxID=1844966 RepID=A0ABD2PMV3_9PLAT